MTYYLKGFIPVISINNSLNPQRTQSFVRKLSRLNFFNVKGYALVVDLQDQVPVQVDKIVELLKNIKKEKNLPIYGFTTSCCSPQSYYLLSVCDQIYTSPTTIFTFQRQINRFTYSGLLNTLKLKKQSFASQSNLLGNYVDAFSSPSIMHYGNEKQTDAPVRLLKYSLKNRQQLKPHLDLSTKVQSQMLGKDIVENDLADGYGYYEKIMKEKYPDAHLLNVEYANENIKIKKVVAIITSPILVLLFLFKVALKWTLIIYLWLSRKKKKQKELTE